MKSHSQVATTPATAMLEIGKLVTGTPTTKCPETGIMIIKNPATLTIANKKPATLTMTIKRLTTKKKTIKKLAIVTLSIIMSLALLTGCGSAEAGSDGNSDSGYSNSSDSNSSSEYTEEVFAMDTYMTLTAYGDNAEDAVTKAIERITELDGILSTGDNNSEISKLNESGSGTLSDDPKYIVAKALELWESTDGEFDIAIYPLMEEWGFTSGDYKVPSNKTIKKLLKLIDCDDIDFDEETGTIAFGKDGMKIDLGGIAKGYTSSEVMKIFKEYEIESGLVNLGGNVQVLGRKINGDKWKVGIEDPSDQSSSLGVVEVADKAVITSGGYERNFEQDGVTYHHILDPATGKPADSGILSVTIVSEDATLADGLSTSLFIMGKEKAIEYWEEHEDEFDAVIVTEDREIYVTAGIEDSFSSDSEYTVVGE